MCSICEHYKWYSNRFNKLQQWDFRMTPGLEISGELNMITEGRCESPPFSFVPALTFSQTSYDRFARTIHVFPHGWSTNLGLYKELKTYRIVHSHRIRCSILFERFNGKVAQVYSFSTISYLLWYVRLNSYANNVHEKWTVSILRTCTRRDTIIISHYRV